MTDKDYEQLERFLEGAKESYEKVENHSYNFLISISKAYQISKSIEKLLKENQPKKGHWVFRQDECGYESFDCSVCGMWFDTGNTIFRRRISSFCPNCGADMREGEHDG